MDSNHNWAISICEDIWIEIFKRLSIETLTQSLCVCKRWKSIISSTYFINLHYSLDSSKTPINLKPYIRDNFRYFRAKIGRYSYTIYTPQVETHVEHLENQLPFPFRDVENRCVGVIRGVICISYNSYSPFDSTILWNPTIHKYFVVPCLPFRLYSSHEETESYAIGFGYDNSKNDFKVVRIRCAIYEIYSVREGLWRTRFACKFKCLRFDTRSSVLSGVIKSSSCFVNGTIYWLARRPQTRQQQLENQPISVYILMFDCASEELTTMEIPREILYPNPPSFLIKAELFEYANRLSALVSTFTDIEGCPCRIEMWIMEEDRTWKKLYRFRDESRRLKLSDIDVYQSSLRKLAPYGPNQWIKLPSGNVDEKFEGIMSDHVYEKSMFLMDVNNYSSYN